MKNKHNLTVSVLKVEYKNYTCLATLNRPEKHNAINYDVMEALEQLLSDLEGNDTTRCLILTGAGEKAFASGGDLKDFHSLQTAEEAKPMARRMMSILTRIEKLPCWTIAGINGPAYGGGCEIMLAFDFRIASSLATFGFTQGKFYLPPGWGGLTRLVERVGRSTALQWLAEAKNIDALTALDHQLVNRIAPPSEFRDQMWSWADNLCGNDRPFIKNLKTGAMRMARGRWESLIAELDPFAEFWESDQHHQRVERFLNREH